MFNYRVIKTVDKMGVVFYAIYGVYYNCAKTPDSWHKEPEYPFGYTLKDLKSNYHEISKALDRPVFEIIDGKLKECK